LLSLKLEPPSTTVFALPLKPIADVDEPDPEDQLGDDESGKHDGRSG
jgi:hypothetical protein